MARCAEDDATLGLFHQLAEVHHQHAVADMADDSQIVRNEQDREVIAALQVAQQIDDLRLDRNVERRYRLTADQQFRPPHQPPRDRHALTLAAGEFTPMTHRNTGTKTNPPPPFRSPRT